MKPPVTHRVDLTQPRTGPRIHRSISIVANGDKMRLALHIGNCSMAADLTIAQLQELTLALGCAEFALGCTAAEVWA